MRAKSSARVAPLPDDFGVVIARIVEKHMDHPGVKVERLGAFQFDRRNGVHGFGFGHPGLAVFSPDRAVNVEALARGRLFGRQRPVFGGPPTHTARVMGRM
jgi:hypothetical protein